MTTSNTLKMTKQIKAKQKKAGPPWVNHSDGDNENGDSTKCNVTFGNSVRGEGWACCAYCKSCAHEQCAGVDQGFSELTISLAETNM